MKVKHASIFFNSKRLATMQDLDISLKTNDGQEVTDGGPVNTDGIATSEISCNNIVPVAGLGADIVERALRHEDVVITCGVVDGKIMEFLDSRATTLDFKSEVASGKMNGSFKWHAGAPKMTNL